MRIILPASFSFVIVWFFLSRRACFSGFIPSTLPISRPSWRITYRLPNLPYPPMVYSIIIRSSPFVKIKFSIYRHPLLWKGEILCPELWGRSPLRQLVRTPIATSIATFPPVSFSVARPLVTLTSELHRTGRRDDDLPISCC
jgi:hypothetical protein